METLIEATIGVAGLPTLPPRDPPTGRRYLISLARAQEELARLLTEARAQCATRLDVLRNADAPQSELTPAYHELAFLRHAKGPMFQAALLVELGHGKIRPMLFDEQSALERVRELSAAMTVAISTRSRGRVEQVILHLHRPLDPAEAGSADDQRAAQFLANTAAANRRTAGLSTPQRLLDMIGATATEGDGRDQRAVQAMLEQARQDIAARIRAGETITAKTVLTRSDGDTTPNQRTEGAAA